LRQRISRADGDHQQLALARASLARRPEHRLRRPVSSPATDGLRRAAARPNAGARELAAGARAHGAAAVAGPRDAGLSRRLVQAGDGTDHRLLGHGRTAVTADAFKQGLAAGGVAFEEVASNGLDPARVLRVNPEHWGQFAFEAKRRELRHAGLWADDGGGATFTIRALFEKQGRYLLAQADVEKGRPSLPSQSVHFPGADRLERHTRDLYGIVFTDHPDPRRWTRHQGWDDDEFPLRKDFPAAGFAHDRTPADHLY